MKATLTVLGYVCCVVGLVLSGSKHNGSFEFRVQGLKIEKQKGLPSLSGNDAAASPSLSQPLMVPLTLIQRAASQGAVCLDGTLPGYHLHRGHGSGVNSWLIHLEGGAWCNTVTSCINRKNTSVGSSKYMEEVQFGGILSNKIEENPDFFNWNRVKLRYCDGASFSGDGENEAAELNFRGQRIWLAAMQELMSKGMQNADQALLSGCSAGGLASILHCDDFRDLFPKTTKVKCLSDAGLFLDAVDLSGRRTLRNMFEGVVKLQEVSKNLPTTCLNHLDPTSCFFPQNLIANIKTPLFLLNPAYDTWQIQVLQDFRDQMLTAIRDFSRSNQNGLFINSCFAHCQSERRDTWFAGDSFLIANKGMGESVGDWYFDRTVVKAIDCAYPCDSTCH